MGFNPHASSEDVSRLLLEVFTSALLDARDAGHVHDASGEVDWRHHTPVDLLERWEPAFEELYRRYKAGPPS